MQNAYNFCLFISCLTIVFMTDPREPSTVKSMVWIWSDTHMLPILWSTVPTKLMVCWLTCFLYNSSACVLGQTMNQGMDPVVNLSFHCDVCNCCAARPDLNSSCWIVGSRCRLWTEVVVCTVWGSVILPDTGANCTSDCLAYGWAISSHPLTLTVM